jgi:hypothetical protein
MNFSQTRFIFSTNQLPNFNQALGMDRRIAIIPFQYRFYGSKERVLDFHKTVLKKESGAILNWAIDGYLRIKERVQNNQDPFTESSASKTALLEYKNTIDPIVAYLTDYEMIADMQINKDRAERYRNYGREIGPVGLTAKDLYGMPEHWDADDNKRVAGTGFHLFCQLNNYIQKPNSFAFARRAAAHCEQDSKYEILEKTREGRAYRLTDEAIGELRPQLVQVVTSDDQPF